MQPTTPRGYGPLSSTPSPTSESITQSAQHNAAAVGMSQGRLALFEARVTAWVESGRGGSPLQKDALQAGLKQIYEIADENKFGAALAQMDSLPNEARVPELLKAVKRIIVSVATEKSPHHPSALASEVPGSVADAFANSPAIVDQSAIERSISKKFTAEMTEEKNDPHLYFERLQEQHRRGALGLRTVHNFSQNIDKLDDVRIVGNPREAPCSGTNAGKNSRSTMPIVSCTVLPSPEKPIAQDLFKFTFFLGLDLEQGQIKDVQPADTWTTLVPNTKGRISYRQDFVDVNKDLWSAQRWHIGALLHGDDFAKRLGLTWRAVTGDEGGAKFVPYNEVLTKIDVSSALCLGCQLAHLEPEQEAAALLALVLQQRQLEQQSGLKLPIVLYNNSPKDIELPLVGRRLKPNEFCEVPNNDDFVEKLTNQCKENPIISDEFARHYGKWVISDQDTGQHRVNVDALADSLKSGVASAPWRDGLAAGVSQLKQMLTPVPSEIRVLHKGIYDELNQDKLRAFVATLAPNNPERQTWLMEAYNLQFRLEIYSERNAKHRPINARNLSLDLKLLEDVGKMLQA